MKPSLYKDLRAPAIYGLSDFLKKSSLTQDVSVRSVRAPVKGAEPALVYANVGVIDIAVDNERDRPAAVQLFPQIVRHHPEAEQVRAFEKGESFFFCDAGRGCFSGFIINNKRFFHY
jgi:hypothetical protein